MSSVIPILLFVVIGFATSNLIDYEPKYFIWSLGSFVGLVWGFLLINILKVFKSKTIATILLYISTAIMTILFGGSLFLMLINYVLDTTAILELMRPPAGGGIFFFITFNSLLELILLQATLYTCSKFSTNTVLKYLYAAIFPFFAARIWTYFYFVPTIFQFMKIPSNEVLSPATQADITIWVNLSWIRCFIDGFCSLCLFVAVYYHTISLGIIDTDEHQKTKKVV